VERQRQRGAQAVRVTRARRPARHVRAVPHDAPAVVALSRRVADRRVRRTVPREPAAHPEHGAAGRDAAERLVRVHRHVRERSGRVRGRPAVVEHDAHAAAGRRVAVRGLRPALHVLAVARHRRARRVQLADQHPRARARVQTLAVHGEQRAARGRTATRMDVGHRRVARGADGRR